MSKGAFILENKKGQVARVFDWEANSASIVYLENTQRLQAMSDLSQLDDEKVPYSVIAEVSKDQIKKSPVKLAGLGTLKYVSEVGTLSPTTDHKEDDEREFFGAMKWTAGIGTGLLVLTLVIGHFFKPSNPEEQQVVTIMPRETVKPMVVKPQKQKPVIQQTVAQKAPVKKVVKSPIVQTRVVKTPAKHQQTSLNQVGALAVLGSLDKSATRGGLKLNAVNTSAGPGMGGLAGSGGMQTTNYGRGLIAAPLGPEGKANGAGGYGNHGAGGGRAGYGKMSLVGSSTAYFEPIQSDAIVEGGLDRAQIAEVIQRHLGQVRYCYEHGLQTAPNLSGRIAIKFSISPAGTVSAANISSSSLGSQSVEACVVSKLKSWKFPQPRGGVVVKVNYPFVLKRMSQQG